MSEELAKKLPTDYPFDCKWNAPTPSADPEPSASTETAWPSMAEASSLSYYAQRSGFEVGKAFKHDERVYIVTKVGDESGVTFKEHTIWLDKKGKHLAGWPEPAETTVPLNALKRRMPFLETVPSLVSGDWKYHGLSNVGRDVSKCKVLEAVKAVHAKHSEVLNKLALVWPSTIRATQDFSKGALMIPVLCELKDLTVRKTGGVMQLAVDCGKAATWYITSPAKPKTADATAWPTTYTFSVHHWIVAGKAGNMEVQKVAENRMRVPIFVNNKAIKAGDILKAVSCDSAEPPEAKSPPKASGKRGAPKTDGPTKKPRDS